MQFDVVSLFPDMFCALTDWGITSRAAKQQRFGLRTWNPRDFTTDNYRTVDDRPYGGGPSTVFTPAGGDLIVMQGRCQRDWQHCVPKQKNPAGARMSLNFSGVSQS